MNIKSKIINLIPFELKKGTSIISIILAFIFGGILTRSGELILEFIIEITKPSLSFILDQLIWFMSLSINVNIFSVLIFLILLIPVYKCIDKLRFKFFKELLIFRDDFSKGNIYWHLNFWGSTNPQKTNRIENSSMIFEANESELTDPSKESGAYFDLSNGLYPSHEYVVICKVKSDENTTMQFSLWLHDTNGKNSISTAFRTPKLKFEEISLNYIVNDSQAMRIHLHIKAGLGKIIIKEVTVKYVKARRLTSG